MIDIKSMGYIRVASTDLDQWRTFAEKVLGLALGRGPDPDHLYYRLDEVSARVVVFPSDVDQLDATGWEVADNQALQDAREHLGKAGVEFEEGTPDELAERRVQELIRFSTRGTTSSSSSTASPTSPGPSSRRTPRGSSPATRGWATSSSR
jgi:3,4-dihydroxy-9,10-secoandrosta-1,3,5(10)-triene-9,17-dione 4,5-dioxygenase